MYTSCLAQIRCSLNVHDDGDADPHSDHDDGDGDGNNGCGDVVSDDAVTMRTGVCLRSFSVAIT